MVVVGAKKGRLVQAGPNSIGRLVVVGRRQVYCATAGCYPLWSRVINLGKFGTQAGMPRFKEMPHVVRRLTRGVGVLSSASMALLGTNVGAKPPRRPARPLQIQLLSVLASMFAPYSLVWYVGMRQTDPTWVEENRGPAWSSHPILIEPEQLPGPIAPASCKEGPTRKGRRSHRRYRWKENRDS